MKYLSRLDAVKPGVYNQKKSKKGGTPMDKVAIVTGGRGGIGRCTAAALRDAGCRVYEFSRLPGWYKPLPAPKLLTFTHSL